MRIRKAKIKDVPQLWEFEKEHRSYRISLLGPKFRLFYPWKVNSREKKEWVDPLKKDIGNNDSAVLVAEQEGKLLGYSRAAIVKWDVFPRNSRRTGYIAKLFVTESERGKKIASRLMENTLKWFRGKGMAHVSVIVYANDERANAVYKKFGFEPYTLQMKLKLKKGKGD